VGDGVEPDEVASAYRNLNDLILGDHSIWRWCVVRCGGAVAIEPDGSRPGLLRSRDVPTEAVAHHHCARQGHASPLRRPHENEPVGFADFDLTRNNHRVELIVQEACCRDYAL
jgi:hypothetical protein